MNQLCEVQVREAKIADRRQSGFVKALRVHKALTADVEKQVLIWMATRTPWFVNSDHLTALGFIAQAFAGAAYALSARDWRALWWVNFFVVLNWLGDSLDGTLARVRDQQRPRYGFYVDHVSGYLRRDGAHGRIGAVGLRALADCGRAPGRVSTYSPSKASWRPTRWDTFTFRTASSVRRRFVCCSSSATLR